MTRPHVHFLLSLLAAVAALAAAPAARAQTSTESQAPSVTAELENPRAFVGDAIPLRFSFENARSVTPIDLSSVVEGLSIQYGGAGTQTYIQSGIENGRRVQRAVAQQTLLYQVVPAKPGDYTIPALEFTVDGGKVRTNPISLRVVEAPVAADHTLLLETEKTTLYQDEWIPITLTWVLGSDIRQPMSIASPELPPGVEVRPLYPVAPDQPGRLAQRRSPDQVQVEVFGIDAMGRVSSGQRSVLAIPLLLRARSPGSITVGAVTIDFRAVTGPRPRTNFDSLFEDRVLAERRVISSKPVAFTVKPLPSDGRPADFSGLVGQFSLRAQAAPTSAAVGEPIALRVDIEGPSPIDQVPPLDLGDQPGFRSSFRVPRDPILAETRLLPSTPERGIASFSTSIRARSNQAAQVPAISLSYFDVATGTYAVASSQPIPLSIRGSGVSIDDEDDIDAGEQPRRNPGGLQPLMAWSGPTRLKRFSASLAALGPTTAIASVAAPPALAGLLFITVAARRRAARDPDGRRRRRAHRRARRILDAHRRETARLPDTSPEALATHALCSYVADTFGVPDPGLTPEQCVALLRDRDPAAAAKVAPALASWNEHRFATAAPAASDPRAEASALIDALRTTLGRSRA